MKFPYKLIDLTHILEEVSPSWDPKCGFKMETKVDYEHCSGDVKFRVHTMTMPAGMGTHMDAPRHCFADGHAIDQLPLTDLIVPCVVIDISKKLDSFEVLQHRRVLATDIEAFEKMHGIILAGSLVIIYTGWQQFWGDAERYRNNGQLPSVTIEAAELLFKRGVVGLGIDTFCADCPRENNYLIHKLFLGAGKYLVENIKDAHLLPPVGSFVGVFPLKLKGGTESPIRLVGFVAENY